MIVLFVAAVLINVLPSKGQNAKEEASVKEVIARLFKGMETGDTASMRSTFAEQVMMVSISRKDSEVVVTREESIDPWLKSVGAPHKEIYYEETWNTVVQVDGDFAQAWCDYGFFLGNKFNHCGVDAFHLYKSKDGWKIFHLSDTRRKSDCHVPKEILDKHK